MRPGKAMVAASLLLLAFAAGAVVMSSRVSAPRIPEADELAGAAEGAGARTWYTCGMHAEVVQDHPGDCPKCGMKLQPMAPDRAAAMGLGKSFSAEVAETSKGEILCRKSPMVPGEIHQSPGKDSMGHDLVPVYAGDVSSAGTIRIDPVTEQNMGVRIDDVIRGPLVKSVRTVGTVEDDETTLATVSTKVAGWVEELHVDQAGIQVHEGEPLFDLYSPELYSAQEEYLAALRHLETTDVRVLPRSRMESEALVRDARTRLEYFDISDDQIRELKRAGKARKTLTLRVPFTGIVTQKNVVGGQRVMVGMDLFRLADLSTVWVIGKVFEHDLPYVRVGQEALMTFTYLPGKVFRGRVTYVYPYLEEKTRELPVRMEFHNPGYELKPGMYATILLESELERDSTLVPDVAVIDTGVRSVVFVMSEPGRYEAREVKTGVRTENNFLQVISGLVAGEKVVVSGQFLLDS